MPYSTCPFCSRRSYSAADLEAWKCPYCGKTVLAEKNKQEKKNEEQG
ncbi:MAG: hypothetical protein ACOX15_06315 [Tepidanaerobacteraceae bacterium]